MTEDATILKAALKKLIQIGKIVEVDYENQKVRVDFSGLRSAWLRWGVDRAGPDIEWIAPEEDEQVLVVFPFGDEEQGVIVKSLYSDQFPAPENTADKWKKVFKDGTEISYDRTNRRLTVDSVGSVEVNGAESLKVNFGGQVVVNAPTTIINTEQTHNGNLMLNGNLVISENLTVAKMATVGGLASAGAYGNAGATILGDVKVQNGDVEVDGISSKEHHHDDSLGQPTSGPL